MEIFGNCVFPIESFWNLGFPQITWVFQKKCGKICGFHGEFGVSKGKFGVSDGEFGASKGKVGVSNKKYGRIWGFQSMFLEIWGFR